MKNRKALFLILTLIFVILILKFVGLGKTESKSMYPTLQEEKLVIINKLSYISAEPKRGDIVAVKKDGKKYIKRVVGVPGDTIEFIDGSVVVNGYELKEPYIEENVETNYAGVIEVLENQYLLLGDNREVSLDGRYWEEKCIEKEDLVGRVVYYFDTWLGTTIPRYESIAE